MDKKEKKAKIDEGLKLALSVKHEFEEQVAKIVNEFENLTGLNVEGINFKGHPTAGKEVEFEIDMH